MTPTDTEKIGENLKSLAVALKEKYKAHQLVLIPAWTFDLKIDESPTYLAVALRPCPKRPQSETGHPAQESREDEKLEYTES